VIILEELPGDNIILIYSNKIPDDNIILIYSNKIPGDNIIVMCNDIATKSLGQSLLVSMTTGSYKSFIHVFKYQYITSCYIITHYILLMNINLRI
jgi:hypothetical protein